MWQGMKLKLQIQLALQALMALKLQILLQFLCLSPPWLMKGPSPMLVARHQQQWWILTLLFQWSTMEVLSGNDGP